MDQQTKQYSSMSPVEEMALDDVLQPYEELPMEESASLDADEYDYESYDDELDMIESQGRFQLAMGALNLISILVGMFVVLVLVTLLFTLFNWVKTDIMTSLTWFQSGLQ